MKVHPGEMKQNFGGKRKEHKRETAPIIYPISPTIIGQEAWCEGEEITLYTLHTSHTREQGKLPEPKKEREKAGRTFVIKFHITCSSHVPRIFLPPCMSLLHPSASHLPPVFLPLSFSLPPFSFHGHWCSVHVPCIFFPCSIKVLAVLFPSHFPPVSLPFSSPFPPLGLPRSSPCSLMFLTCSLYLPPMFIVHPLLFCFPPIFLPFSSGVHAALFFSSHFPPMFFVFFTCSLYFPPLFLLHP